MKLPRTVHSGLMAATLSLLLLSCDGDPSVSLQQPDQWTFVNYWAVWCKPCIKEIPELNQLHALPGYRVVGVNFDGAVGAELEEQVAQLNIQFPLLEHDPSEELGTTRPQVLPTTLLLSPEGALVTSLIGPQTKESLLAAVEQATEN